jgi:prepilin-type processing-associated H-X9-DG protein
VQFKCPADKRVGKYQGSRSDLKGTKIPAARDFSMSQAVGTDPYTAGCKGPLKGTWLTGSNGGNSKTTGPWRTYCKETDVVDPGPSKLWVLIDEDQWSVNDAAFGMSCQAQSWIDWPGTYHNNACGIAFADGHSEIHKWVDGRTKVRVVNNVGQVAQLAVKGSVDWTWLAERTSAKR